MVSAFTQGNIDLSIFLQQPDGFISAEFPEYVLRLNKALYGLKQSARIWYLTLKDALIRLGFKNLETDNCIFVNSKTNIILCVYFDDIAVIGQTD